MALSLSVDRGGNSEVQKELRDELFGLPQRIIEVQRTCVSAVKSMAAQCVNDRLITFMGAGPHIAPAGFGSAKVRELCPCQGAFFPLEEFHHYRTAKPNEPLFIIAPKGPSVVRAADAAEVARYDGGRVYSLVSEGDREVSQFSKVVIEVPHSREALAPILFSVPMQLFAYELAKEKIEAKVGYHPMGG